MVTGFRKIPYDPEEVNEVARGLQRSGYEVDVWSNGVEPMYTVTDRNAKKRIDCTALELLGLGRENYNFDQLWELKYGFDGYAIHCIPDNLMPPIRDAIIQAFAGKPDCVKKIFRVQVMGAQDSSTWELSFLEKSQLHLCHSEKLDGIERHDPRYIKSRIEYFLGSLGSLPDPELLEATVQALVELPWSENLESDSREAIRRLCKCSDAMASVVLTEIYTVQELIQQESNAERPLRADAPMPSGLWKWERTTIEHS